MIILCTHNSGGVGKTTLAIHAAGILQAGGDNRILMLDCDDQADTWQFYSQTRPQKHKDTLLREDGITIIWNSKRDPIRRIAKLDRLDHIIIDIDSPLKNTVQVMVDNQPDHVLIPINASQSDKAIRGLPITLSIVTQLELTTNLEVRTTIVPLGVNPISIQDAITTLANVPRNLSIAPAMPNLQDQMKVAIYKDRKYIWDYEGYADLKHYFENLINS